MKQELFLTSVKRVIVDDGCSFQEQTVRTTIFRAKNGFT